MKEIIIEKISIFIDEHLLLSILGFILVLILLLKVIYGIWCFLMECLNIRLKRTPYEANKKKVYDFQNKLKKYLNQGEVLSNCGFKIFDGRMDIEHASYPIFMDGAYLTPKGLFLFYGTGGKSTKAVGNFDNSDQLGNRRQSTTKSCVYAFNKERMVGNSIICEDGVPVPPLKAYTVTICLDKFKNVNVNGKKYEKPIDFFAVPDRNIIYINDNSKANKAYCEFEDYVKSLPDIYSKRDFETLTRFIHRKFVYTEKQRNQLSIKKKNHLE